MRATTLTVAALAGAAWSAPALAPIVPAVAGALALPRRISESPGPDVALTFDDGPDPRGTPAILAALAARNAVATFFLVGEQVERDPALAGEIVAAGHRVAIHGQRHRLQLRLTPGQARDDIARAVATIGDAAGSISSVYRPPYGIFSPAGLAAIRSAGLRPMLWSRWGRDWRKHTNAGRIATELTGDVRGGDVLLLHDSDRYSAEGSWRRTAAALPLVLDVLTERGLGTVTL